MRTVQRGGEYRKATDEDNDLLGSSLDSRSLSNEQGQAAYVKAIHYRGRDPAQRRCQGPEKKH